MGKERYVTYDHGLSSLGKPRDANLRSSVFYPTLTFMMDSIWSSAVNKRLMKDVYYISLLNYFTDHTVFTDGGLVSVNSEYQHECHLIQISRYIYFTY